MKRSVDSSTDQISSSGVWKKQRSEKHGRDYWFNTITKQSVWEDPTDTKAPTPAQSSGSRVQFEEEKSGNASVSTGLWTKGYSERYKRDYWFHSVSGEKRWDEPPATEVAGNGTTSADSGQQSTDSAKSKEHTLTPLILTSPTAIAAELERERRAVAVDAPTCPREIATADLAHIVQRLRTETISKTVDKNPNAEHSVVFRLPDDDTAMITRAVQEDQILKTRLKVQLREGVADLPSFWDVWERDPGFRDIIIHAQDPNEAKWEGQRTHNYKLATTFMPAYAKALYEHFGAKSVLDPCAGWGDRLVGAAASSMVERYVCFDPNTTLRPGYAALMKLFGHEVTRLSAQGLEFSNGFASYTLPFEEGALLLPDNSFDLVFTSPPFFDYEMYNPRNPQYTDWIDQFYTPLFVQACRLVKPGHHFAIHVGDTSAGAIGLFLKTQVQRLTRLKLVSRLGLHGMMSGKTRSVWVYRKALDA